MGSVSKRRGTDLMTFFLKVMRRLSGRSGHHAHGSVKLLPSARFLNAQRDPSRITINQGCIIGAEFFVFGHGGQIEVGQDCYVGEGTRLWSGAKISIGNRVLISHGVNIFDNDTHPMNPAKRHEQFLEIRRRGHPRQIDLADQPVTICDDAWIGANAIVLKGVTISEGAVVAAGSVVTKDVPAYCVVAGNPARVVKQLEHPDG
jgi:acetyltransferase-like isoleucine patch superfamily enzyme